METVVPGHSTGHTPGLLQENPRRPGSERAPIPESSQAGSESNECLQGKCNSSDFGRVPRGFSPDVARRLNGTADPRIPELAVMADVLNPEQIENNPLNTELETPTLDAATEHSDPSTEPTH